MTTYKIHVDKNVHTIEADDLTWNEQRLLTFISGSDAIAQFQYWDYWHVEGTVNTGTTLKE